MGDDGEFLVRQPRHHIQWPHQLAQTAGNAHHDFAQNNLAVLLHQGVVVVDVDDHQAGGAAPGLGVLDGGLQALQRELLVAESGERVHQRILFQALVRFHQQLVFLQQAVLQSGQTIGGINARQQLLVHGGLVDEVVHALIECLHQGLIAFSCGEQHDVGEMIGGFVQSAHAAGQFQAVHFRHQPVGDQHIDGAAFQHQQGLLGTAGGADVGVASGLESTSNHGAGKLRVIHDHDGQIGIGHRGILVVGLIIVFKCGRALRLCLIAP